MSTEDIAGVQWAKDEGRQPEPSRDLRCINPGLVPPRGFIAMAMDFAVVAPAERDGELVADFAAECAALGEAQVMGVAGLPAADQAGLLCDEPEVIAVTDTPRFREEECGRLARDGGNDPLCRRHGYQ